MSKTYGNLLECIQKINFYSIGQENTKGVKKLSKIAEKIKKHIEDYNQLIEDIRLDNASVDDKQNLIIDDKGDYKFSKEGLRKVKSDIKELSDKEFEFTPINVVNPKGLETYAFLEGWVVGVTFDEKSVTEEDEEL